MDSDTLSCYVRHVFRSNLICAGLPHAFSAVSGYEERRSVDLFNRDSDAGGRSKRHGAAILAERDTVESVSS